jgi:hypothetical protein
VILAAYASGYPRNYSTDEDELRGCLGEARAAGDRLATGDPSDPRMFWWPTTVDFRAEAERRGAPLAVANFTALVAAIRRYRNLTNLHWFGHGAARELQFGGAVFRADDVPSLGAVDLSSHLTAGATITFLACNAGQSPDLMRGIANAVPVPIHGFTTGVRWVLSYRGQPPHRAITRRGLPEGSLPSPTISVGPG